jgi:hypothetical protein
MTTLPAGVYTEIAWRGDPTVAVSLGWRSEGAIVGVFLTCYCLALGNYNIY